MVNQPSMDDQFLIKVHQVIEDNIDNENFGVEDLADSVGLSRSMLHRKLVKLTGKCASEHITQSRLLNAKSILEDNSATVSETAYKVGFKSPSYFIKVFKKYFNVSPGDVKKGMITDRTVSLSDLDPKAGKLDYSKKLFIKQEILIIFFIILLVGVGTYMWISLSEPTQKSIAVLPFKNLSEDETNQYFADAMMAELLNNLSHMKGLKVISRTSSEKYRDSNKSLPEIAEDLHVSYIIEGSVQKYENSANISIQLIDARKDQTLWSENFNRELKDIFKLQSEIAKQVASELETVLSPGEIEQINKTHTTNLEAYNLYLKGRFFWDRRTENDAKISLQYFKQSLEMDSNYSLAYAGLADAYHILASWGWYPKIEGYSKSKAYALKALSINNDLAEAHATLGCLNMDYNWNWDVAEKELMLAIELNPNYATAHHWYAGYLRDVDKQDKARVHINRAIELNPHAIHMHSSSVWTYMGQQKYNEALKAAEKVNELENDRIPLDWIKIPMYMQQGNDLKIIEVLQQNKDIQKALEKDSATLTDMYNKTGIEGVIRYRIKHFMKEKYRSDFNCMVARYFLCINDKDAALDYLEKAFELYEPPLPSIKYDLHFKPLRNEPRFLELLNRMNMGGY
ncbi:helix-turn-helix domain-containing protein [Labilibacter sediminis]|nr:helix-turn-helix domain-containing protein [Labilibacter sediminis]